MLNFPRKYPADKGKSYFNNMLTTILALVNNFAINISRWIKNKFSLEKIKFQCHQEIRQPFQNSHSAPSLHSNTGLLPQLLIRAN